MQGIVENDLFPMVQQVLENFEQEQNPCLVPPTLLEVSRRSTGESDDPAHHNQHLRPEPRQPQSVQNSDPVWKKHQCPLKRDWPHSNQPYLIYNWKFKLLEERFRMFWPRHG